MQTLIHVYRHILSTYSNEPEEIRRTFILDTTHKIMEIYFLSAIIYQCNIALVLYMYNFVHKYVLFTIILVLSCRPA